MNITFCMIIKIISFHVNKNLSIRNIISQWEEHFESKSKLNAVHTKLRTNHIFTEETKKEHWLFDKVGLINRMGYHQ